MIEHWFMANGSMLKLEISNGECWGELKHLDTKLRQYQDKKQNFFSPNLVF